MLTPLSNSSCIFFTWTAGSVPDPERRKVLERLRSEEPEFRCLFGCRLITDDNVLLDQSRHLRRVLAGRAGAGLQLRLMLLPGQRIADLSATVLTRQAHRFLAVGRCQQWDRPGRRIVEPGIGGVIFALEGNVLAGPKLPDDDDSLDQPVPSLLPSGPGSDRRSSFSASPEPTPRNTRPGYRWLSDENASATTAVL
jgi:hypothetical protein